MRPANDSANQQIEETRSCHVKAGGEGSVKPAAKTGCRLVCNRESDELAAAKAACFQAAKPEKTARNQDAVGSHGLNPTAKAVLNRWQLAAARTAAKPAAAVRSLPGPVWLRTGRQACGVNPPAEQWKALRAKAGSLSPLRRNCRLAVFERAPAGHTGCYSKARRLTGSWRIGSQGIESWRYMPAPAGRFIRPEALLWLSVER